MIERTLLGQVSGWGMDRWPEGYGNWPFNGQRVWPADYGGRTFWACALLPDEEINWRRVQRQPWPEGYGHP